MNQDAFIPTPTKKTAYEAVAQYEIKAAWCYRGGQKKLKRASAKALRAGGKRAVKAALRGADYF